MLRFIPLLRCFGDYTVFSFSIPKGILLCGARSMRWLVCVIPQGDKELRLPQKLKKQHLSFLFIYSPFVA
jgi:hypothetical protein